MEETGAARMHVLRACVEAGVSRPCVMMVTSALDSDGAGLAAYRLAQCLATAGHRTKSVTLEAAGASGAETLRTFVQDLRSRFDFAVIDAASALHSGNAILLASHVDAVLLSVRLGRVPVREDEIMMRALRGVRANVIGSVAAAAEAIAEFEHRVGVTREPLEEAHAGRALAFSYKRG
ncbi:MAG: hypothetical protein JO043_03365 [Candidatus Eremiobacteraeota bacterium]|nr:hypothetical protein [Candidatus Eremiobacteraeota bacterium]